MSYRTTINGIQVFGNNESYEHWDEYIRSQGIEINEEGCYEGDISDFHGAVTALENIVKDLMDQRKADWEKIRHQVEKVLDEDPENEWALHQKSILTRSLLDFSNYETDILEHQDSILDTLFEITSAAYAFFPYILYTACRSQLERMDPTQEPDGTYRIHNFKFKAGQSAHVKAG